MKYFLIIVFIFFNCKNIEQKPEIEDINMKMYGQWSIDKMTYNNEDYKSFLYINFMVIDENHKISIPESHQHEKDSLATWSLSNNDDNLKFTIKSQEQVFDGEYDLKFIKNEEKKLLGIELISNDTYIKAYKFFQDFDIHGKNW